MKGVILRCLEEMVREKYGEDLWSEVAGGKNFPPTENVDDSVVLSILSGLCIRTGKTLDTIAEEFGRYWIGVYSQRLYKNFFIEAENARDFILKVDEIHQIMTKNVDTKPPRFMYEWKDEATLIMRYESERKLIDLAVGLLKGVAEYYGEDIDVRKIDDEKIEVKFNR